MRVKSLKEQKGIAVLGAVAIVVVIVLVAVAAVIIKGKNNDTPTPSKNSQPAPVTPAKSISSVKLGGDYATGATALSSSDLANVNKNIKASGTQYFNAEGGLKYLSGTTIAAEWGTTATKVEGSDFGVWVKALSSQSGSSGLTRTVSASSSRSVTASDGKTYPLQCVQETVQSSSDSAFTYFCLGEVQKSSLLVVTEGSHDSDAKTAIDKATSTLNISLQ